MDEHLQAELATWAILDERKREEKFERERVRYPRLIEQMGINLLQLDNKIVVDLGSGPISMVSMLEVKKGIAVDPLVDEYRKIYPQSPLIDWLRNTKGILTSSVDLVICSNAIDHFEKPREMIGEVIRMLRPGGYFSVFSCINNATINPNPAHFRNLTYSQFRSWVDSEFETVHERMIRYGWRKWRGKVGQISFAWLGRLTTKY